MFKKGYESRQNSNHLKKSNYFFPDPKKGLNEDINKAKKDCINLNAIVLIDGYEKKKDLDWGKNLVGNVKQEFMIEKDVMEKIGWGKFLASNVREWILQTNKREITKFNIMNSWIVRQFKNEYNPSHWHNGHVSGVGYLKVPSNLGETLQKDKVTNNNGKLEMVHGSKAFLCKPTFRVTPKVGDFYFFPHYLMHAVYPFFDSDEERRSVSFNATVDQSLFNE